MRGFISIKHGLDEAYSTIHNLHIINYSNALLYTDKGQMDLIEMMD
jgi:hypothetical protein